MHGTVEWLPGSPLGNTGFSWSDVLLGNLPNIYVYAANNPSESIIAKRRGIVLLLSPHKASYTPADLCYPETLLPRASMRLSLTGLCGRVMVAGYGTIISHNVPPYGRAGLYKQLAALRELVNEFREDPANGDPLRYFESPHHTNSNECSLDSPEMYAELLCCMVTVIMLFTSPPSMFVFTPTPPGGQSWTA